MGTNAELSAVEALRRLYEIQDQLTWACLDLTELIDTAKERLPALSREARDHQVAIQAFEALRAGKPETGAFVGLTDRWRDETELLLDAAYEQVVDYKAACTYLPQLNALRNQVGEAIPAVRERALSADRYEVDRLDRSRVKKPPRPRNRLIRP